MILMWLAAGCADDAKYLEKLDGTWAGTVTVIGGPFEIHGGFDFDDETEILLGEVTVGETEGSHTYAVRRWEVIKDVTYLEMTDLLDGTRGLDLNVTVAGELSGDATVRYPCQGGPCGWEGTVTMQSALPTGGTGATPTPPTETGTVPTGGSAPTPTGGGTGTIGGTGAVGGTGAIGGTSP